MRFQKTHKFGHEEIEIVAFAICFTLRVVTQTILSQLTLIPSNWVMRRARDKYTQTPDLQQYQICGQLKLFAAVYITCIAPRFILRFPSFLSFLPIPFSFIR